MNTLLFACVYGSSRKSALAGCDIAARQDFAGYTSGWIAGSHASLLRQNADHHLCDAIVLHPEQIASNKILLVMDFDSTLVTTEGIDLLAKAHGKDKDIMRLTARAMQGELDFTQSLNKRLAMLAGMSIALVEDIARHQQPLQPGMQELVHKARTSGMEVAIISGGFDLMIAPVAARLGISRIISNRFALDGNRLAGCANGEIIDATAKRNALGSLAQQLKTDARACIALGDGANDIPMLQAAGIGIALHPKPKVRQANPNAIVHTSPAQLDCFFGPHLLP